MKITTLIPAYKPKFLIPLLRGLGNQSTKPERIIFSDDSPGHAFRDALRSERLRPLVEGLNIEIVDGPRQGFHSNVLHLFRQWKSATELLHIMLDDDILYPDFYERHLAVHASGAFSCSISRRWTALETGQPVGMQRVPKQVSRSPLREVPVTAGLAFASTIPRCRNWFGEFSNAVYREDFHETIGAASLAGIAFNGLHDLGCVLCASLQKPVCYLHEHLGAFRINADQLTKQTFSTNVKQGHLAWMALALAGLRVGQLTPEQVAECVNAVGPVVLQRYAQESDTIPFLDPVSGLMAGRAGADERFLEAWNLYAQAGS